GPRDATRRSGPSSHRPASAPSRRFGSAPRSDPGRRPRPASRPFAPRGSDRAWSHPNPPWLSPLARLPRPAKAPPGVGRAARQAGTDPPPRPSRRPLGPAEPEGPRAPRMHLQAQGLRGARRPIQLVGLHPVQEIVDTHAATDRAFHGHPEEDEAHALGAPVGI